MTTSKNIITFDVGGRIFRTNRSTITSLPGSLLSDMIIDCKNSDDPIFIDRNPEMFQVILDYYRNKTLVNHQDIHKDLLERELDFYRLSEYVHNNRVLPVKSDDLWAPDTALPSGSKASYSIANTSNRVQKFLREALNEEERKEFATAALRVEGQL